MTSLERKIVDLLEKIKKRLLQKLEARGGRGISLAEHIDRLEYAIDALQGELQCPHCETVLTSLE